VKLDDVAASRLLVQPVDVLGDERAYDAAALELE
jgi:hypothetical protein